MSILETVTVFVGIPAAVYAVVAGLVYMSGGRRNRRYRPGRPYEFTPVWFVSSRARLAQGAERAAIEAGPSTEAPATAKGGARGTG